MLFIYNLYLIILFPYSWQYITYHIWRYKLLKLYTIIISPYSDSRLKKQTYTQFFIPLVFCRTIIQPVRTTIVCLRVIFLIVNLFIDIPGYIAISVTRANPRKLSPLNCWYSSALRFMSLNTMIPLKPYDPWGPECVFCLSG